MLLYSCWVYCNCGTLFSNLVKSKECVHDTLFAEALEQLYDRQGGRSGSSLECIPPFLGEGHPCSCDVPVALNDESTRELDVSGQCDLDNKLSKPHRVETLQSQTPPLSPNAQPRTRDRQNGTQSDACKPITRGNDRSDFQSQEQAGSMYTCSV